MKENVCIQSGVALEDFIPLAMIKMSFFLLSDLQHMTHLITFRKLKIVLTKVKGTEHTRGAMCICFLSFGHSGNKAIKSDDL